MSLTYEKISACILNLILDVNPVNLPVFCDASVGTVFGKSNYMHEISKGS